MRSSQGALVKAVFEFQKLDIDYEELIEPLNSLDPRVDDGIFKRLEPYERDRVATIELWTKERYYTRDKNNFEIRLANLFEVIGFACEFPDAHIEYGEYCGFDSVLGRILQSYYFPIVYADLDETDSGPIIIIGDKKHLPKYRLVVTHEEPLI